MVFHYCRCYENRVNYTSISYPVTNYAYQTYAYKCGFWGWRRCNNQRLCMYIWKMHFLTTKMQLLSGCIHTIVLYCIDFMQCLILYRIITVQGWLYFSVPVYYNQAICCPQFSGTYPNCVGKSSCEFINPNAGKFVSILFVFMVLLVLIILVHAVQDGLETYVIQVRILYHY